MVLRQLQSLLVGIYDVPLAHDVAQFLLTDRSQLPAEFRVSPTDEQLLVADDEAGLALGLFLEPAVLARLDAANPLDTLNGANLADYWTALEGVSHFVYLAWNAGHDRPVSLLELELQAEVDKYVSTVQLLRAQDPTRFPVELHRVLFERSRVSLELTGERTGLYRRANQYAARFCAHLGQLLEPASARAQGPVQPRCRRQRERARAPSLARLA